MREVRVQEARERSFTGWSLVTLIFAIPVWYMVFRGVVLSREYDGGIFLSVGYGLANGLDYYVNLWDNKDPFFGAFMAAASHLSAAAPFFLDLFWIPITSVGVYLIARTAMGGDRALFLALVAAPFVVVGPAYVAGWTHTPGIGLLFLGWGLLAAQRWLLGGLVVGLLLLVKITAWPIAFVGLILIAVCSARRLHALMRSVISMAIMVGVSIGVLVLLGWFPGFVNSFQLNSTYSGTLIEVFGYQNSVSGHLNKLVSDATGSWLIAMAVLVAVAVLGLLVSLRDRSTRSPQFVIVLLLAVSLAGTVLVFALTYLWPHHLQAASIPLIMGLITIGSIIPGKWGYLLWVVILVPSTFVLSGWGTLSALTNHVSGLSEQYDTRIREISEEPVDAFLLNTLVDGDYTYARLGTNDDRGYLGSVREGVTLGCPYFHLYDFSPVEAFADHLVCMRTVDVVLVTEKFEGFANSMNRISTNHLLDYVNDNFNCTVFEDRKLCVRR